MVTPRVLVVTTGLHTGGAEGQLALLLSRLSGHAIEAIVVSLAARGPVSARVEALGVPVWHLDLKAPLRVPGALSRLMAITRAFRPQVVQGWMYHGNLAALVAWKLAAKRARLIWGIRQSLYDLRREKPVTRQVIRFGARCSRRAHAIVYNSYTARAQHEAIGFARGAAHVIDNGFDNGLFRPDLEARDDVRRQLRVPPDTPLIGLIARYHPMKGHDMFLRAAALLAQSDTRTHFLLAGRDVVPSHPLFAPWLGHPTLGKRLHLLGERADIPRLTAALDIASSSSWGEAFPNAIGEAMSCGVPCVATDVGDVRRILGEAGVVLPVGDEPALADAWARLLANDELRHQMGTAGRRRVADHFSLDRTAARYAALYSENLNAD